MMMNRLLKPVGACIKKHGSAVLAYVMSCAVSVGLIVLGRHLIVAPPNSPQDPNTVDWFPPLLTAMGAVLLVAALLWNRTSKFRGPATIQDEDSKLAEVFFGTSGVVITIAAVFFDSNLGPTKILPVVGGAVLAVVMLATGLFGLAVRRKRLNEKLQDAVPEAPGAEPPLKVGE